MSKNKLTVKDEEWIVMSCANKMMDDDLVFSKERHELVSGALHFRLNIARASHETLRSSPPLLHHRDNTNQAEEKCKTNLRLNLESCTLGASW